MITDLSLQYLVSGPPDDVPAPMVVLVHGRGADANDLAELASVLDTPPGFRFVFPNGPTPFEPYPGTTFGWTWFEGWPPAHESLVESRMRLNRFLDEIVERYPVPDGRLAVGGFSQGALMALDVGLRRPSPPAAIVAMSGGLYEADLGDTLTKARVPIFLAHGAFDDVVPIRYAQRARRVLEDAGLDVTWREYPMGHQIVMEEVEEVREFLGNALKL